jgi:hydroxymethylglutaryl-CoA lyase
MDKIIIHEVGPRDGLQIEEQTVPLEQKIKWIEGLISSGVDIIQLGSFVNPKRVPQMADTEELFKYFLKPENKKRDVVLSGLVLNERGVERGMDCGTELFCMGVSASETHSRKNTGMGIEEAQKRIIEMAKGVMASGRKVQASVQSAFGCGYEGKVPEERVISIISGYLEEGIKNISLADTAGHANPAMVEKMFSEIFKLDPNINAACHFHDTYGMGLANCYAALKSGVKYFESSFAGLGGCPFTAIASGNVCTEDLVHMLHRMGMRNDIDIKKISGVSADAVKFFNRDLPGVVYKTGEISYTNSAN